MHRVKGCELYMADNEYKISLGVGLDIDDLNNQINEISKKSNKIKLGVDNKEVLDAINDIKKSIQDSHGKTKLSIDTTQLESNLKDVSSLINDIKSSIGTLDSKSGMKPLLSSINQISNALEKVSTQFDSVVTDLKTLSNKNFNIDFGIKMNGSNPVKANADYGKFVRNTVLPQLKEQAKYLENLLGGQDATIQQMFKNMKHLGISDIYEETNRLFNSMSASSSLSGQMQALNEYIGYMKKIASINNIDMSKFNSNFSQSANELINSAKEIQSGAQQTEESMNKLKQVFGGSSVDAERLTGQLDSIIQKLSEIGVAIKELSSGISIDGLTQDFKELSGALKQLVTDVSAIKTSLGQGFLDKIKISDNNKITNDAKQTGRKISDTIKQSVKQSFNIDDVIDKQVLSLMSKYSISGKKGSKAFNEIRQSLIDYKNSSNTDANDILNTSFDDDIFNIFSSGESAINKATSAVASHVKVVDESKMAYADLLEYIRAVNKSGVKIHLPDSIKQEYGDDFRSMRSKLGSAFTTGKGGDFESWVAELNEQLGNVIDLSQGAEYAFGDLVNKVSSAKGTNFLSENELFKQRILDRNELENDIITSINVINEAEQKMAQTSTESTNTIVQNEDKKIKAKQRLEEVNRSISDYEERIKNIGKDSDVLDTDDATVKMQSYMNALDNLEREKADLLSVINATETSIKSESQQAQESANTVVQSEERKQQAYRETAQEINNQSKQLVSNAAKKSIDNITSKKIGKYFTIDKSDSDSFNKEMENLVKQWTNGEGKLVNVDISTRTYYDKDAQANIERLHQAQVTYNNELGTTIKKTIAWRNIGSEIDIDGTESPVYGFAEVASQYSKSLNKTKAQTDAFIRQQKQSVSNLTNQINQLNRAANDQNASRAIKDSSHLESLSSKYNEIISAIQRMGNASSDTFVDEQNNVKTLISEYKSLVSEYRNAENVSSKMKGTDFQSGLNIARNDLEKFKAQAKDFPQITNTINELDKAIEGVGDTSSLNKFNDQLRVARSELAKIKSETTASNRSQKVGINVSGLQSKIVDLQRISPEINKFETEIDGAKVTVQSLLSDLSRVNTQSDFSVINSKWRAFTNAAKAAGIAITEVVNDTNAKLAKGIQIKVENGTLSREVQKAQTEAAKLSKIPKQLDASIDELVAKKAKVSEFYKSGDIDGLVRAYKEYEQILASVNNQLAIQGARQKSAGDTAVLKEARRNLSLSMDKWLQDNTRAAGQFGDRIRNLQKEIEFCDNQKLTQLKTQFANIKREAELAGKTGQTFGEKLKTQFSKYSAYLSVASIFMYATQAMRDMFEQVKTIDSAMTELKKVTDETSATYSEFLSNAASRAQNLGTTVDGLISSTSDFARLGYDFADAVNLAEVANIYTVVGDDIDSVDTATQSLISTMKAFKNEASGLSESDFALSIVDKMNEVSNNFAISSGGIGEALTRSASSMKAAGNTLDETIALITAANTVVNLCHAA